MEEEKFCKTDDEKARWERSLSLAFCDFVFDFEGAENRKTRILSSDELDLLETAEKRDNLVLTQDEIDMLLDAINSNGDDLPPVEWKEYDFIPREWISKKHEDAIRGAAKNFCDIEENTIEDFIKKHLSFSLLAMFDFSYGETIASAPKSAGMFELQNRQGRSVILEISGQLMSELIATYCNKTHKKNKWKNCDWENFYNECGEKGLRLSLKLLNNVIVSLLNEFLFKPAKLRFKCKGIVTNPEQKKIHDSEKGLLFVVYCNVEGDKSLFSFWIPRITINDKLDCYLPKTQRKENLIGVKKMVERKNAKLEDVGLKVKAVLGQTAMSLKEIENLKKGTVIELDNNEYSSNTEIEIDGTVFAKGDVVYAGDKLGVKIREMC